MTLTDDIRDIADTVYVRFAALRDQEADRKARLADTQKKKLELEAAVDRVELLRQGGVELPAYSCVNCYVFHDQISQMSQIPSDTGIDLFRCRTCEHEMEIEP